MGIPEIDYARLWREMLDAWALPASIVSQASDAGASEDQRDGWQLHALQFQRMTEAALSGPPGPLLSRILTRVTAETTVLDVGAGTGRQALRLAPHVKHIIAVEPSPAMRAFLAGQVQERSLDNIEIVTERWQDAQVPMADIVLCANVFYDVQDLVPFVQKLDAHARNACYIEITFRHPVASLNDLWLRFRGIVRPERPDYFDAVAVLHQMGIYANVNIEAVPSTFWYASLEEAVEGYRRRLHLAPDPQRDEALRQYIEENSRVMDGRVYPGPPTRRIVVLWWEKA